MATYTATDAKREFGEVLMKSQSEPVSVTRNGKPIAVVVSEATYRKMKIEALKQAIAEGEASGFVPLPDKDEFLADLRTRAGVKVD